MLRFVVWLVCSYFDRINGISPVVLNILQKKEEKRKNRYFDPRVGGCDSKEGIKVIRWHELRPAAITNYHT